jgi:hypothetical protein
MKITGMGNKTKSERKNRFVRKYFTMQESGHLNLSKKRPEGDFLEKSELGFSIFFC